MMNLVTKIHRDEKQKLITKENSFKLLTTKHFSSITFWWLAHGHVLVQVEVIIKNLSIIPLNDRWLVVRINKHTNLSQNRPEFEFLKEQWMQQMDGKLNLQRFISLKQRISRRVCFSWCGLDKMESFFKFHRLDCMQSNKMILFKLEEACIQVNNVLSLLFKHSLLFDWSVCICVLKF